MTPSIKPNYKSTFHRDGTVSYWSVYKQQWVRTSVYDLTCRHDDYAAIPEKERMKISKMALGN